METPVPISNTEVKHSIGDGTAPTVWESSTMQPYNIENPFVRMDKGVFTFKQLLSLIDIEGMKFTNKFETL